MKPEIKKLWIDALLSGEYQQGTGYLCQMTGDGPMFCCLGVLTDLAIKSGVNISITTKDDRGNDIVVYGDSFETLPSEVMEWSGLDTPNGAWFYSVHHKLENPDGHFIDEVDEIEESLVERNDTGSSFEELAKDIEEFF